MSSSNTPYYIAPDDVGAGRTMYYAVHGPSGYLKPFWIADYPGSEAALRAATTWCDAKNLIHDVDEGRDLL